MSPQYYTNLMQLVLVPFFPPFFSRLDPPQIIVVICASVAGAAILGVAIYYACYSR